MPPCPAAIVAVVHCTHVHPGMVHATHTWAALLPGLAVIHSGHERRR